MITLRKNKIAIHLLLLVFTISTPLLSQENISGLQIAFLSDVHLQDLYGKLEDSAYKGIQNPKDGSYVTIRTMESQLHSTRIFNENYYAFIAALEDIANRKIKYVALPGDYSDDGQPLHIRGLQRILDSYTQKFDIQFFITTGNHDPAGPFAQESGKNDFLGEGGKRQPIYSKEGSYQYDENLELPVLITKDIAKMGYLGVTDYLHDFGFFPKAIYKYWATPFSTYSSSDYTFAKATESAVLDNRTYAIKPGFTIPDVSYVVEPVEGLWIMAIDGNVYIPKTNTAVDVENPANYSGASIGYNNVLLYKKHLIEWVRKITAEAKKQEKIVIAFSHFPMIDFNDDASDEIAQFMAPNKWQLDRVPKEEVAQAFADAGLRIHFGGHMHINDTGIRMTTKGNMLVNVQTPSLAAYIPAYKLLTIKGQNLCEIETIVLDDVPKFDSLFELYKMEYDFLKSKKTTDLWNNKILKTKNYHDFTDFHLKELVRLRFLPDDWSPSFKDLLFATSGADLLVFSNLETTDSFATILQQRSKYKKEWTAAKAKSIEVLKKNNLQFSDFKRWNGFDLIVDFYRIRSADRLAIKDIGIDRIKQYNLISGLFLDKKPDTNSTKSSEEQRKFELFFTILKKFLNGAPADHFLIDYNSGTIKDLK